MTSFRKNFTSGWTGGLSIALLLALAAAPAAIAQAPSEVEIRAVRALIAAGNEAAATAAADRLVARARAQDAAGAALASALQVRAEVFEAEGGALSSAQDRAEADRKAARAILLKRPADQRALAQAGAGLVSHYVRRGFGKDALAAWRDLVPVARQIPEGPAIAAAAARDACAKGQFDDLPMLGVEVGAIAAQYAEVFAPGDGPAIECVSARAERIRLAGREIEKSTALARLAAKAASAPATQAPVRARAMLAMGRVDAEAGRMEEALAGLDRAVADSRGGGDPCLEAEALMARAEIRGRRGLAGEALADAQAAVLVLNDFQGGKDPLMIEALIALGASLATDPARFASAEAVFLRARTVAVEWSKTQEHGWEERVGRAYTALATWHLAQGDVEGATRLGQDMSDLVTTTHRYSWRLDWPRFIAFPNNVLISLARKDWNDARQYLKSEVVERNTAEYYVAHKYHIEPVQLATALEFEAYLSTFAGGKLDFQKANEKAIDAWLAEALKARRAALPANHPSIANHFALRAAILARRGKQADALRNAREGAALLASRRARGDQTRAFGEGLLHESIFQQLVARAWEASQPARR